MRNIIMEDNMKDNIKKNETENNDWLIVSKMISKMQMQVLEDNLEMQKRQLRVLVFVSILSIIIIFSIVFLGIQNT